MKKILILGAGRSSSTLISYMLKNAEINEWQITVADRDENTVRKKVNNHPHGETLNLDINNNEKTSSVIQSVDLVISMLPANLHYNIAKQCIEFGKSMVTASYISQEIQKLHNEAKNKGVLLLNEMGVDPGIDHMSAKREIDKIKSKGGRITEFESNTGGLIAPKHDNNPWNYKITWNPGNVVRAGIGGARFLHNGKYKYIPYHKIFKRYERIHILDLGEFEAYPNRDSLKYQEIYGLENISTMFRGTIRRPGFCKAWNIFVELGATGDNFIFQNSENLTYRDFINSFLAWSPDDSVEEKLAKYLNISEDSSMMYKLRWLGIFDRRKIGLSNVTPAEILQTLIEEKLMLDNDDKDMIVMQHQFSYEQENKNHKIVTSMVAFGDDSIHTAMSKTVGLPVAIGAKNILNGTIKRSGVTIPTFPEIYTPVLEELENYGIKFIRET